MRRRGAALVEFAMVFPILMLCFYGMIELSRVLLLQHTVDTASYEGARCAIVPGATSQDAIECASSLLTTAKLKNATVTVTPTIITESTPLVTVLVELPVRENAWMTPFWFTKGTVKSEVTLITERPPIIQLTGIPQLKAKSKKTGPTASL